MNNQLTQTQIINLMLSELGSPERLNSIHDEQSHIGRRMQMIWPMVRDSLLEAHPWNFAIKRAKLNQSGEPISEYSYQYALPSDCLRWLPAAVGDEDYFEGEQEGGFLLSNNETAIIRYISRIDDVRQWSASFTKAVIFAGAARLAEAITSELGLKDRIEDQAAMYLRSAKRKDGLATGRRRRNNLIPRSNILTARNTRHSHLGR